MRLTRRIKSEDGITEFAIALGKGTGSGAEDIFTFMDEAYWGLEKLVRYEDISDDPARVFSIDALIYFLKEEQNNRQSDLTMDGETEADHIWLFCQDLIDKLQAKYGEK